MLVILFLIMLVLGLLLLIGLIKPKWVIPFGNPGRGKVVLFYFTPLIAIFLYIGYLTSEKSKQDWDNPEGVERLSFYKEGLTELPEKLKEFKQVHELNLKGNEITSLNEEILRAMPALKSINLHDNPINEVPEWLGELGLEELTLDGTQITSIPLAVSNNIKILSYTETPLAKSEKEAEKVAQKKQKENPDSESFGQFALRKLMGKEYGYQKEFKKGTLYYTKSVTADKVEKLGQFLEENGYFSDEREISMQITFNGSPEVEAYELRGIYASEEEPEEDIKMAFKLMAVYASASVFDNKPVHFLLTDNQFDETLYTFKSQE